MCHCSVSFVLFSNIIQIFSSSMLSAKAATVAATAVVASLYRFFVDCLMKRKNLHVIQYACCCRFIKIRKLYRVKYFFVSSHHEYRSQNRSPNRQYVTSSSPQRKMCRSFSSNTIFSSCLHSLVVSNWAPEHCHSISLLSVFFLLLQLLLLLIIIIAFLRAPTQ